MSKKTKNISINTKPNKKAIDTIPEVPKNDKVEVLETAEIKKAKDISGLKKSSLILQQEGLDPNHRVDLMKMMHETFRMDPHAAEKYNMSQETINKINEITAIGQIAILSCEILYAKNPFALKMNAAELNTLIELGDSVGLNIDVKSLPKPDENGVVEVPSTSIKISDDTKQQIEHEKTVEYETPEMDVEKIYNDENAIAKAIEYIFTQNKQSVFKSVDNALQFIKNVRLHAAKASNDNSEILKMESRTLSDWFNDITNLFKPTLLFNGIGRHMTTITSVKKNPVTAFLVLRNAAVDKSTGIMPYSEDYIAELTKMIITWVVNTKIESYEKSIKELDPKKNKSEIDTCNSNIDKNKKILEYLNNPSTNLADSIIENMKSDDENVKRDAIMICSKIRSAYYPNIDFKNNTYVNLNHNIQQYVGIIINMFKDPSERSEQYVMSNITELVSEKDITNKEEKKEKKE